MGLISLEQRAVVKAATIINHTTRPEASNASKIGADTLDVAQTLSDGFYRIVQVDSHDKALDAAVTNPTSVGQSSLPVVMDSSAQLQDKFWKLTRQYGVKDGFTIVPVIPSIASPPGVGETTKDENNVVVVQKSTCYPIWIVRCDEHIIYRKKDGSKGEILMYRILKVGSESCWQTSESNAVNIATVADRSDGTPRVDQLYQLTLSVPVQSVTTNSVDTISVTADDSNIVKKFYFGSGVDLKKTYVSVQLTTDARDQGWANEPDEGLWSWFEIAIFKSKSAPAKGSVLHSDSIKKDSTGNTLTWLSHRVALSSEYTEQTGPVFGKDHELWKNVETGDIVGVLACAQYACWKCDVRSGSLKFLELVADVNA